MKKILSLLALMMLCVMGANAQTTLIDYPTSKDGTAISGSTVESTVKIHDNADAVACYSLKNGYLTDAKMNGNHIKLSTEGGFKKGDVITIGGAINNSDETKWGTVALFSADATEEVATVIHKFENFINGRLVSDDIVEQSYTLEDGFDALYLGRDGNTGTNVTLIKVVRPEQSEPLTTNKTIVLVPGVWNADGATFAAYAFNETDTKWFPFIEASGSFATQIPDNFTKIVLVRLKPATDAGFNTENNGLNWDNKWNQTEDIDFTAIADQTIFTISDWGSEKSPYTTSNPLQEAREKLTKIITMAEMLDAEGLATQIAAAKDAVAGTDISAMETVTNDLMAKALPKASEVLTMAKEFAEKYGYTDVSAAISAVEAAILPAMGGNMEPIETALNNLIAVAIPAAQDAIGKIEGYAEALENEALNTAIAEAKAAVASGNVKDMITKIKALEEPFAAAAEAFVGKVASENIEDASVVAALQQVAIAKNADPFSIVAFGDAVKELIKAYKAYQLEQNPVYTVAGTADLTGYDWDVTKNEMKKNENTGLYEWTAKFITVTNDQQPKFKVVKNYTEWYPEGGEETNWVITPAALEGEGIYTSITIIFNAETKEITVSGIKRETPVYADDNVYFWESPDGYVNENGGVAVHNNGGRVNYAQAGYYTISLNGKADFSSDIVTITLNEGVSLSKGDKIAITAFRNKDASGKKSGALLKFDDGSTVNTGNGEEFVNINAAVSGTSEYGTEPNTVIVNVPESAVGSKTIQMTRSNQGTNLFITKIEIAPNITTGISTVAANVVNDGQVYNLAGQKVQTMKKGLYIINGKKVLMK